MMFSKKLVFLTLVILVVASVSFAQSNDVSFSLKPSFSVDAGLQPNLIFDRQNPVEKQPQFSSSKGKALFLSFLIPGLGEYYSGHKTRAKAFFITEVVLWSTYASFKVYENWTESEYRVFASDHARIDPSEKSHKYFVNIGNYDNIYEYNAVKLNYRQLDEVYPDSYAWDWDSDANRFDFEKMRIRSDNANYRALFMLGTILVNHIVSAIDAVWVSRSLDDHSPKQSLNFKFDSVDNFNLYQVSFSKSF